jgi:hypothetical protein
MSFETPRTHSANPARRIRGVLAGLLACTVGCTEPTKPAPPILDANTMIVRVSGRTTLEHTAEARGGFQWIATGSGSGIHLQAEDIGGLPLVVHIPDRPVPGAYRLERWDPRWNFVRRNAVLNVVRGPSLSFGAAPVVTLGHYTSVAGGTLEIDAVTLPDVRAFSKRGSIRGRLHTRAAVDQRLVPPGIAIRSDTLSISAEFRVELENWPDGSAAVTFSDGVLAGTSSTAMVGSGSQYFSASPTTAPRLVIGIAAMPPESADTIQLYFGTRLRGPGRVALGPMGGGDMFDPGGWANDFAAGRVASRRLESVSGALELDFYDDSDSGWGEARGRLTATFDAPASVGGSGIRTSATITFHVPVGYIVDAVRGLPWAAFGRETAQSSARERYPTLVVPGATDWILSR